MRSFIRIGPVILGDMPWTHTHTHIHTHTPKVILIVSQNARLITINRIVGFPWNDPGTDVEDELPTPASSPVQCTIPAVMTGESGGPQELRDNFDLDLAKVLLDISVMPTMVFLIEDSVVIETTDIAEYAAPEDPTIETVTESPGFAVPQESGIVTGWVPRYSPDFHDALSGWGSPTDVNRAVLTLYTTGNGHVTAQLHRNVGPVPTESAVATGGGVAVARARRHD